MSCLTVEQIEQKDYEISEVELLLMKSKMFLERKYSQFALSQRFLKEVYFLGLPYEQIMLKHNKYKSILR